MTENYFSLFGISPAFDLDLKAMESAYFSAQRTCHPDRFVGRPDAERAQAMQRSVDANQAYETLKSPLPRAQYLLHLQGIAVGTEHDTVKPSPELLTESMEWREEIAEAKNIAALDKLDTGLQKLIAQSVNTLSLAYGESMWQEMAQETLRLSYLLKAREAIKCHPRMRHAHSGNSYNNDKIPASAMPREDDGA